MAEEPTLGRLVADAAHDLTEIVSKELALAKAELRRSAVNGAAAGGLAGAAAYLVALATVLFCAAAAFGLAEAGLPAWAALAITGAALLLLAALLVGLARWRAGKISTPERTARSTGRLVATLRGERSGR